MARAIGSDRDERETVEVPDGAHAIVVGSAYRCDAPEGHPDDRLQYERGDEIPRRIYERVGMKHPQTLALIDNDGEVLSPTNEVDRADLHDAIAEWQSGGTFRAPEYEPGDES